MATQTAEQNHILNPAALLILHRNIIGVFSQYLQAKSGLKGINAHKKPAAEMMQGLLSQLNPVLHTQATSTTTTTGAAATITATDSVTSNFHTLCQLLALRNFLEFSKQSAASKADVDSKTRAKRAVSITTKTKVNTEGDLIPNVLGQAVALIMAQLPTSTIKADIAGNSLHQRIDLVNKALGDIYDSAKQLAVGYVSAPLGQRIEQLAPGEYEQALLQAAPGEHIKIQLRFAMCLIGYLMQQGDRNFTHSAKSESAKVIIRMLTDPQHLIRPSLDFYRTLFKEINEGIQLARKQGGQERSTLLESILVSFRDRLIQVVVIDDMAMLNIYDGQGEEGTLRVVKTGFTQAEKLALLQFFIDNGDPSPLTIPVLQSIKELVDDPKQALKLRMDYLNAVFNPPPKNKQKPKLPEHFYQHGEQIVITLEFLLQQPKIKQQFPVLSVYAYLYNRYLAENSMPVRGVVELPEQQKIHWVAGAYIDMDYVYQQTDIEIPKAFRDFKLPQPAEAKVLYKVDPVVIKATVSAIKESLEQQVLIGMDYQNTFQAAYTLWRANTQVQHKQEVKARVGDLLGAKTDPLKTVVNDLSPRYANASTDETVAQQFVQAILADPRIKPQIPQAWCECGAVNFINKFPKTASNLSQTNKPYTDDEGYHANRDGAFLATCGVNGQFMGAGSISQFARLVLAQRPWCVVALGAASDYGRYWEQNFEDEHVQMTVLSSDQQDRQLQITDKTTSNTHIVSVVNAIVEDNTPVKFNYQSAQMLLRMTQYSSTEHPILIHCASGVGRTGQIKFLMALLKELETNTAFAGLVDKAFTGPLSSDQQQQLVGIMKNVLFGFRQTRYSLQSESQLQSIFPALCQLRVVQCGLSEEFFNGVTAAVAITDNQPTSFPVALPVTFQPQLVLQDDHAVTTTTTTTTTTRTSTAELIAKMPNSPIHSGGGAQGERQEQQPATDEFGTGTTFGTNHQ